MNKTRKGVLVALLAGSFVPIWRSGGRKNMTFWGWIWNHTIFGPEVEYVPEEDYEAEICCGVGRR
jgi:hypothetical protein